MQKEGDKNSQAEYDALLSFGDYPIRFMHFGEKESGDKQYPYQAIVAPTPNQNFSENWNIDKKFGSAFGADFIVFVRPEDPHQNYALLMLPSHGNAARFIDINAETYKISWKIHQEIAMELTPQFQKYIVEIQNLAQHAAQWTQQRDYINTLRQRIKTLKEVTQHWSDVVIEEQTLDRILKLIDLFVSGRKPSPKGILLSGPAGTGKTLIARKLSEHANCHFEAVNIADLKAGHIGQTAPKVKALWQRCRDHAPTILFIDECESAFARRGSLDTDSFGNELVQTFLSEWDGFNQASGKVLVIAATNRKDIIDDAILSRFTSSIEIGLPNDKARKRILTHEFQQADLALTIPDELVTETAGMSGRDLHTLVASLVAENINRKLTVDELLKQVRQIRGKGSTQVKNLTWEDIILPTETLTEFQNLGKELRNAEKLATLGISTPKGILLYGPPGTGKTQIARVLATQSGLSFIGASTADLKANYIGQSASKVKQLFEQARSQAPCIVFIDEMDIVAGIRNSTGDSFTQEIVGQLLQELDGIATKEGQVFLLAASNHPENIDSAVMSRLERKIEIGLPTLDARIQILSSMLTKKPVNFEIQQVATHLAHQTADWSGRDLNSLITRATRLAVNQAIQNGQDIETIQVTEQELAHALKQHNDSSASI